MNYKTYTIAEHFIELKFRIVKILIWFLVSWGTSYYYSKEIYYFLTQPLVAILPHQTHKMIYTNLAEGFLTYLQLSLYTGILLTIPIIICQVYLFIAPGLYLAEKNIFRIMIFTAPILFYLGNFFVFYCIIPKAWQFFLSFESANNNLPIILEAKVSEYLNLLIQFSIAFGLSFQIPLILIMLNLLQLVSIETLINKRRISIIANFIIAAILTPPDIFSQIALAIPLILLYEFAIMTCKILKKIRNQC